MAPRGLKGRDAVAVGRDGDASGVTVVRAEVRRRSARGAGRDSRCRGRIGVHLGWARPAAPGIYKGWRRAVGTESRHVLIVEDEMVIALEIESQLRELGYSSFDYADSPDAALRAACEQRPDLVTLDFRILGGTGLDAIVAIVRVLGPLPAVMITGNSEHVRMQCDYPVVDKPLVLAALRAACLEAGVQAGKT